MRRPPKTYSPEYFAACASRYTAEADMAEEYGVNRAACQKLRECAIQLHYATQELFRMARKMKK